MFRLLIGAFADNEQITARRARGSIGTRAV
jgi:hypothetical protein